jgi:hypothetical protein
MRTIIIRPTNYNNLTRTDIISSRYKDQNVFVERMCLWLTGYFKLFVPRTTDEINEWKQKYQIWDDFITPDTILEYIGDPEYDLDMNDVPFDFKPYDFLEKQSTNYLVQGSVPDNVLINIHKQIQEYDLDGIIINNDWSHCETKFHIMYGFTIINIY